MWFIFTAIETKRFLMFFPVRVYTYVMFNGKRIRLTFWNRACFLSVFHTK